MKTGRPKASPFQFLRCLRSVERRSRLEGLKLRRGLLARTLVLLELEAHPLAFIETCETRALNSGDVHEHIAAAGFRLNEAVAFLLVEPLYGAGSHVDLVFRNVSARPGGLVELLWAICSRAREAVKPDCSEGQIRSSIQLGFGPQ